MKSLTLPFIYTKEARTGVSPKKNHVRLRIFSFADKSSAEKILKKEVMSWRKNSVQELKPNEFFKFDGNSGYEWVLVLGKSAERSSHHGKLEESNYSRLRDLSGQWFQQIKNYGKFTAKVETFGLSEEDLKGVVVGLNLAAYTYKGSVSEKSLEALPQIKMGKEFTGAVLLEAEALAKGVNLARHLVNSPPNFANPETLSTFIKKEFSKGFEIEVWNTEKLSREKMGLLLGVGEGAAVPPRLVILKYKPRGSNDQPIALVGKGITFDTGGLDIKPSSGMRLMKKDMGGAAALIGLASWIRDTRFPSPVNIYLAFAENSVDGKSMRPSDVLTARSGATVEIHNTDAEGRLILADAIDVALDSKPQVLIDVATLTGAIKVALGSELAGLFSNDDQTSESIERAAQASGDLCWRMPLMNKYWGSSQSPFADFVNAVDGFGGAITAALFLEKFVKNTPWAHLDIYAWADRAQGALSQSGGSGQGVQMLAQWLSNKVKNQRLR